MGEPEVPVVLPEPCPSCGGPPYLEFVDVQHALTFEACRRCGRRWKTPFGTVAVAKRAARTIGTRSTRTSLAERLAAAGH